MINLIISAMLSVVMADATVTPNIVHVPNGSVKWSETVISGDANHDNTVNIADAVLMQKYMSSGEYDGDVSCFDINSDGIIDSFDMILMRQAIINPETVVEHTYAVDILKSVENLPEYGEVCTNTDEMSGYLSEFILDISEIQTYLDKYDDTFFENNNLILMPFTQKYGRGVFYNVSGVGKIHPKKSRGIGDDIFIALEAEYGAYRVLYPITNTQLLIQAAVPKSEANSGDNVSIYDAYEINTDMESIVYKSPDNKYEFYVTQETMGDVSDIRFFLKSSKISYKAITFFTAYGDKPFTEEGEWSVDEEGNNVFSNDTTYSITWYDDYIFVTHQVRGNEWESVTVDLDGVEIDYEYYIKED
ncbi:MAG: dockerin type I repeat-containing protein [Ruminococcus sp.]|nr:dockerin type I repeat-containing protein [Ruminococcus sp.]